MACKLIDGYTMLATLLAGKNNYMEFNKNDLFLDYSWNRYRGDGKPTYADSKLLNKNEGYEVLYFINHNLRGYVTKENLHRVEQIIAQNHSSQRAEAKTYVLSRLLK